MLKYIAIKNFKSIKELTLDFSFADHRAPNGYKESDYLYFLQASQDRLVPVLNIYGGNASGKSNIIQAVLYAILIIKNGFNPFFFNPNKLLDSGLETTVEIAFFNKSKLYKFCLAYNQIGITKESLFFDNQLIYSIALNKLNAASLEHDVYDSTFLDKIYHTSCERENVQVNSFLKSISDRVPNLNADLTNVQTFLFNQFNIYMENGINPEISIQSFATSSDTNDVQEALNNIAEIIQKIDVTISKFEYRKEEVDSDQYKIAEHQYRFDSNLGNASINIQKGTITFSNIITHHQNSAGETVEFKLRDESLGTRTAFSVIATVLKTLHEGGVLIFDELDRSLHPFLLNFILKLFKNKEYNKFNAQLISTLHTTDILEETIYKRSEFSFVNKNPIKGTFVTRLAEFEGIRNDMNFRDRYLQGRYSGVPIIYE